MLDVRRYQAKTQTEPVSISNTFLLVIQGTRFSAFREWHLIRDQRRFLKITQRLKKEAGTQNMPVLSLLSSHNCCPRKSFTRISVAGYFHLNGVFMQNQVFFKVYFIALVRMEHILPQILLLDNEWYYRLTLKSSLRPRTEVQLFSSVNNYS